MSLEPHSSPFKPTDEKRSLANILILAWQDQEQRDQPSCAWTSDLQKLKDNKCVVLGC